jgi:hypothetical protein
LKSAERRGFLEQVPIHTAEKAVEQRYCLDDRRALVQHHAFRPGGHRRIGHLSTRWNTFLDHVLQHLGRPDAGHGRRLADPENLLLHFRQAFETNFCGEITTGDHNAEGAALPGACNQRRKIGECQRLLDLRDQSQGTVGLAAAGEHGIEKVDILRSADKRVADQVGTVDHGLKIYLVLCGQRRQAERGVGKVHALLRLQLGTARLGASDDDHGLAFGQALDDSFQLAVVITQPVTNREPRHHFRQRNRGGKANRIIQPRFTPCHEAKAITNLKAGLLFGGRNRFGSDLWPGNIHQYLDIAPNNLAGVTHETGHSAPGFRTVMGAIDTRDIHAGPSKVEDQVRSLSGRAWQGHHDPCAAAGDTLSEQHASCGVKIGFTLKEGGLVGRLRQFGAITGKCREGMNYGIYRRQHPSLQPAQRRQTQCHQAALQEADVMMAQGKIMGEVVQRSIIGPRWDLLDRRNPFFCISENFRPQHKKLFEQSCGAQSGCLGGDDVHGMCIPLVMDAGYYGNLDAHVTSIKPSPSGE